MPGIPFQSKLEPYFDLIVSHRRARRTWQQIAELITEKGTPCTRQAVQEFYKRKRRRPYAMGMEPDAPPPSVPPAQPDEVAERVRVQLERRAAERHAAGKLQHIDPNDF